MQVVLVANSLPALNDVTANELPEIVAEAAKVCIKTQWTTWRLLTFYETKNLPIILKILPIASKFGICFSKSLFLLKNSIVISFVKLPKLEGCLWMQWLV